MTERAQKSEQHITIASAVMKEIVEKATGIALGVGRLGPPALVEDVEMADLTLMLCLIAALPVGLRHLLSQRHALLHRHPSIGIGIKSMMASLMTWNH